MKIAAMCEPLERPSLEELKDKTDARFEDEIRAHSGLIYAETIYYDFWAKKETLGIRVKTAPNRR